MQVTELSDVQPRPRRVAVGEFDGVHLGHREVISGSDTVLTFEPHPLQVVRPEAAPKLLKSLDAKAELIGKLGVDELVVIPFDHTFAQQTPQEFIDHVLIERLQAAHVSVGENFRFGHRAAGDTDLLAADSRFETRVVPLVEVDGEVVSSSHIRALVLAGEVENTLRQLNGLADHGKDLGRLVSDLLNHFRNLLIFQVSRGDLGMLEVSETEAASLAEQSKMASAEGLTALGVTLLTVGVNGPDYDLTAAEALCKWRNSR